MGLISVRNPHQEHDISSKGIDKILIVAFLRRRVYNLKAQESSQPTQDNSTSLEISPERDVLDRIQGECVQLP